MDIFKVIFTHVFVHVWYWQKTDKMDQQCIIETFFFFLIKSYLSLRLDNLTQKIMHFTFKESFSLLFGCKYQKRDMITPSYIEKQRVKL